MNESKYSDSLGLSDNSKIKNIEIKPKFINSKDCCKCGKKKIIL